MARQSIPRSDLYGDLGVDPSADGIAIEAAYRSLIGPLAESDAAKDVRRAARVRLAYEWLTDPDRRSRYDTSRARAAARAEKAADVEARELAGAAAEAIGRTNDIAWPARDLDRPAPGIQWSSTPADALVVDVPRKARRRLPIGAIALVALAVVVGVATYNFALGLPSSDVANVNPTASPPAETAASETPGAESPSPQPLPTTAPTTVPTPAASEVPEFAAMQQSAWDAIQALHAAAAAGDVATAQTHLGDTAPGLRASGLRRATFAQTEVGDIGIQREGALYVANAGVDRLTSTDGVTWTFDYADRPLAAYRSPGAEPVHDLWWVEPDGEHHLYLQVAVATISRSGVAVTVKWSFDPSRPDDATYFERAGLVISSVVVDGVDYSVSDETVLIAGYSAVTLDGPFDVEAVVGPELILGLTVSNPRTIGGDPRLIETVWTLDVR